jgi:hypothetical protein
MHGYWPFDIVLPVPKLRDQSDDPRDQRRALFVFCSAHDPDDNAVAECVEAYCDKRRPPDVIYLIAPVSEKSAIEGVLKSEKLLGRARGATRYFDTPRTDCLLFGADGSVVDHTGEAPKDLDLTAVKRRGLTHLIRQPEHPVYIPAPPSRHFVVPSESHASSFFRVGSAMADGAAIDFIAFCCLPFFVDREVKHVYCDTGAISPVVYAVNTLRNRIRPNTAFACVGSFKSYKGAKDFKFRDMGNSLVLISLSITGGLAAHLRELHPGISDRDIVTLFILHEPAESARYVCDLRKDEEENPKGFEDVTTYKEDECVLCKRGSTRIHISTEQFLPGHAQNEQVMLRVRHSPDGLGSLLGQLVGKEVVRAHYKLQGMSHATAEVFFDLEKIFKSPNMLGMTKYQKRLRHIVDQAIPVFLNRIICLDSPASVALATVVAARAKEALGREVEVIPYNKAVERMESLKQDSHATLVVAAAAASGRSLMAAAQLLRHIQRNNAITYLIGLARFPTPESLREVEDNLTRGERAKDHGFFVVERVFLPLGGSQAETAWDLEVDLIKKLQQNLEDSEERMFLATRLDVIRGASHAETRGLSNDLFWPKADGGKLELREGFAFFPFHKPVGTSQADVYFTMVAVLHSLRSGSEEPESLFQFEYLRRVLSPRCFDRFNDGVIQAALLRAALLPELDYSIDESFSKEMWQILDFILRARTAEAGEAYREFLLALAMERMRLRIMDMDQLLGDHGESSKDGIDRILWARIRSLVEERKRREEELATAAHVEPPE